jgi:hypothetical protein
MGFVAMTAALSAARAQTSPLPVVGVVFDSLHNRPLGNAFVTLTGVSGGVTSDELGRFHFSTVAAGAHMLAVQHELLDSIGLEGLSRNVRTGGSDTLRIAIPSFGTLWARFCGGDAPSDTAFVFCRVTDTEGRVGLKSAAIEITWADIAVDKARGIVQRGRVGRARSDTTGWYALCGVPAATDLQIRATAGGDSSGTIDVLPGDLLIRRRDIRIAHSDPTGAVPRGVVSGSITAAGAPVGSAKLVIDGAEARTGPDGRFVIPNVKTGTRQLEITSIGMKPALVTVDVSARDTAFVVYGLQKIVALQPVKVIESSVRLGFQRDYDFRKKEGLGTYMDSAELAGHATVMSVFEQLPGSLVKHSGIRVESVQFVRGTKACTPALLLDGVVTDQMAFSELTPDQIAAIEVYKGFVVPADIGARVPRNLCGVIVIWTKRAFP